MKCHTTIGRIGEALEALKEIYTNAYLERAGGEPMGLGPKIDEDNRYDISSQEIDDFWESQNSPAHATTGQPIFNALSPTGGAAGGYTNAVLLNQAQAQLRYQEIAAAQQQWTPYLVPPQLDAGSMQSLTQYVEEAMKAGLIPGPFSLPFPKLSNVPQDQPPLPPAPSPAELRQKACDGMGEARCSTACYTAARHVEKVPKKVKGWRNAKDLNRPATMPFWMVPVPGAPAMMQSVVATIPDLPARGRGKLEHDNPHLRPRWR